MPLHPHAPARSLAADLLARQEREGRPIRIGLVGCGEMGTDIVTQVRHMQGLTVAAIAERRPGQASGAFEIAGLHVSGAQRVEGQQKLDAVIESGKTAVTDDHNLICKSPHIDVIVDATGKPAMGAHVGLTAIEHGKHLVMMNVEADVTVGAFLKREARRQGVVYSLGAGDEPSSCIELINFVTGLGFPIVAAGKGKNNPLKYDATPDEFRDEAQRRNMNVRMLVEFVDGSKTMVEMAAISNATGLVPDVPGMHGPAANMNNLEKVMCPKEDGGVLSKKGVVDFSIGDVAPGVFVIAEMSHPRLRERMNDLKLGEGPYFKFIRPYHLTSLEVPLTCARVVLHGVPDMEPLDVPVSEVCAVAKKDLKPGDALDAIGQYTYRAYIMTAGDARAAKAVPCGLVEGGKVTQAIKKGELLTYTNTAVDGTSKLVALRQRQDQMLGY